MSDEQRQKVSQGLKSYYASHKHPNYNRQLPNLSQQQKDKISQGLHHYYATHPNTNIGKKYPNRRRPGSQLGKRYSEMRKGEGNPFYGKHHTEQHKEAMRQLYQGKSLAQRLGPLKAERAITLISLAKKGKGNPTLSKLRKDPEFIRRLFLGLNAKPNKPEKQLITLINENHLPYKYVGDGQFILGEFCPDFVNIDGKKQVIELFGIYWHNLFDVAKKVDHYAQYGFKTLIIWQDELNDLHHVLQKIKYFAKSPR